MATVIKFPVKEVFLANAQCAESAFQPLTARKPNTLAQYLRVTGNAFHTIIEGDFNQHIRDGDCLTVEPTRVPQLGDLVAVIQNGNMALTVFQPGCQILGVVVGKTTRLIR